MMDNLQEVLAIKNKMALPTITKVVVNIGLGLQARDNNILEAVQADLHLITGQKPVITYARRSVASFKIRQGYPMGLRVTLRGQKKEDFLQRLLNITLPRSRDFRGLPKKSFDKQGNYCFGMKEMAFFAEINDVRGFNPGMDIICHIKNTNPQTSEKFLRYLGFPLQD